MSVPLTGKHQNVSTLDLPETDSPKQTPVQETFTDTQSTLGVTIKALKTAARALPENKKVRSKLASDLEKQVKELQKLIEQLRS